jgi:KUP system potassium uptake protein
MFTWYNGRKITNRYLRFLPLAQYVDVIKDLRNDFSLPKISSNLVFLTKANRTTDIESKIVMSILRPKRADHYWLIHVDILDDPRTMDYKVTHLIPGIMTRIDFYLGFKVEPRINLMFRNVTNEMAREGEIDLFSGYPSLRKHNVLTDFKFILINQLNTTDIEFKVIEKLIISLYLFITKYSHSDVKALGFDSSNVTIEEMPLGADGGMPLKLVRKK